MAASQPATSTQCVALRRWGHSCTAFSSASEHVLVAFGGFGSDTPVEPTGKANPKQSGEWRHRDGRLNDVALCRIPHNQDNLAASCANAEWALTPTAGDVPRGRVFHSCVGVQDTRELVVFGGRQGPARPMNDTFILSLDSMEWRQVASTSSAPAPRWRHSAALVGNRMFVFGGRTLDETLGDLWSLDISSGQWTQHNSSETPSPRHSHTCTLLPDGARIAIIGGYACTSVSAAASLSDGYILDTRSMEFSPIDMTPMPSLFSHSTVLLDDNTLVVCAGAGFERTGPFPKIHLLRLDTQEWTTPECRMLSDAEDLGAASPNALPFTLAMRMGAVHLSGSRVVLFTGGGSACFSFGTSFNTDFAAAFPAEPDAPVRLARPRQAIPAEAAPAAPPQEEDEQRPLPHECSRCGERFASRNRLFKHIRAKGHRVVDE